MDPLFQDIPGFPDEVVEVEDALKTTMATAASATRISRLEKKLTPQQPNETDINRVSHLSKGSPRQMGPSTPPEVQPKDHQQVIWRRDSSGTVSGRLSACHPEPSVGSCWRWWVSLPCQFMRLQYSVSGGAASSSVPGCQEEEEKIPHVYCHLSLNLSMLNLLI